MVLGFAPFVWKKLSVGLMVLIVTAFLWINSAFIYQAFAEQASHVMLIYLILYVLFASSFAIAVRGKVPIFAKGLTDLRNFVITFGLTAAVMFFIPLIFLQQASVEIFILALGFGLLHSFVKAYIEEIVFRWILPIGFRIGDIFSNILFALFHMSVLTSVLIAQGISFEIAIASAIVPMTVLFFLGMLWAWMRGPNGSRFGIAGAVGSHFSYNLASLGILAAMLGVG